MINVPITTMPITTMRQSLLRANHYYDQRAKIYIAGHLKLPPVAAVSTQQTMVWLLYDLAIQYALSTCYKQLVDN